MNINRKLDFRLVPATGIAAGKGYRAEFVRRTDSVIDIDGVIAEAQQNGAFFGMAPNLVRSNLETFFNTLIGNVLADGQTRKLDDYLEVSLNLRGLFEQKTDDYDPSKHELKLTVKHLSAFRQQPKNIQPVNVNRIKQFRLSYITAADGLHTNHQVVFGQDFIVRGSNLTLPACELSGVYCQVKMPNGSYFCSSAPIISKSDSEIRCSWPPDYESDTIRRPLYVDVSKVTDYNAATPDINRSISATILPA